MHYLRICNDSVRSTENVRKTRCVGGYQVLSGTSAYGKGLNFEGIFPDFVGSYYKS